MKVCTFERKGPLGYQKRLGVFYNSTTIIDVNLTHQLYYETEGYFNAAQRAATTAPHLLSQWLKIQENPIEKLQETIQLFEKFSKDGDLKTRNQAYISFDLEDEKEITDLASPIDSINCYRDFYAHEKHVKKGFEKRNEPVPKAWYEIPAYYKGPTTGFIGNDDLIPWPSYTDKLDYELELAAVMSKDGMNIKAKDAYKHIFGFTILNDISARDIQKKEMAVRLGPAKGKDFCSVLGPVITTIDEFNYDEPDLLMTATVNQEEWSRGRSSDAHYSWAEMIEHCSKEEWVLSTDVLGSGTVGTGCGLELDKWIQPGDLIELEVEKIGMLKNIVGTKNGEL